MNGECCFLFVFFFYHCRGSVRQDEGRRRRMPGRTRFNARDVTRFFFFFLLGSVWRAGSKFFFFFFFYSSPAPPAYVLCESSRVQLFPRSDRCRGFSSNTTVAIGGCSVLASPMTTRRRGPLNIVSAWLLLCCCHRRFASLRRRRRLRIVIFIAVASLTIAPRKSTGLFTCVVSAGEKQVHRNILLSQRNIKKKKKKVIFSVTRKNIEPYVLCLYEWLISKNNS